MCLDELHVSGHKCYTEASKWLLKLLIGFYRKHHMMHILYASSIVKRERYVGFGGKGGEARWIPSLTLFFEQMELLYSYNYDKNVPHDAHYRLQLWRFFLLEHINEVPEEFRKYVNPFELVNTIRIDGKRNDKRLNKLFELVEFSEYE